MIGKGETSTVQFIQADEMEIHGTTPEDIDELKFGQYFKKEFEKTFLEKGLTYEQALKVKRVLRNNRVTLAGLLFFGNALFYPTENKLGKQSFLAFCSISFENSFWQ